MYTDSSLRVECVQVADERELRVGGQEPKSNVLQEVLAANQKYAADFGDKAKLAMPRARRFAILSCVDARLDPAQLAGLAEGDAHVIRNAGERASHDVIRSLIISYKLLGTPEWFVIHHSNCGMEFFSNDVMRGLLATAWRRQRSNHGTQHPGVVQ